MEHESISVYMYRWGHALYRSSGIRPNEERHPHVIKDFYVITKEEHQKQDSKTGGQKCDTHQIQLKEHSSWQMTWKNNSRSPTASSWIFPTYPSRELNEMSAEDSSGDEHEVNEIARNKRWVSNPGSYNRKTLKCI